MVILEYVDEAIKKSLKKLKRKDKELYRHIENALRNIQEDPVCGIKIPIRLIPKEWKSKYNINNLYKYNLPNAWRLLYSLIGDRVEVIAIILGGYDHKSYGRLFRYN